MFMLLLGALGITGLFLGIFLYSFIKEPRRLINGFWLNCVIMLGLIDILVIVVQHENQIVYGVLLFLAIIAVFILLFGIYILIGLLFWNSRIVMKRESSSVANLLTFILAIALSLWMVISWVNVNHFLPKYITVLMSIVPLIVFYLICSFLNYLSVSIAYLLRKKTLDQDYLIILGSGLIDGEKVSPLLASRINRGIKFYEEQKAQGKNAKIVFSGGQGGDELISEAAAMQKYAVAKGIPLMDTLLEDQSVNTLQNMTFSKDIMTSDYGSDGFKSLFFTNNYHVFRAGLFAKTAGLKAHGVGSKTAFYFLPNALLREFVGILSLHKKRHLYIFLFIFGVIVAQAALVYFF